MRAAIYAYVFICAYVGLFMLTTHMDIHVTDIGARQERVMDILARVAIKLDRPDGLKAIEHKIANTSKMRVKLGQVRLAMSKVTDRVHRLQGRLNALRIPLGNMQKNALVETGPFTYRCVYRGTATLTITTFVCLYVSLYGSTTNATSR
jgi:hypothetical protein